MWWGSCRTRSAATPRPWAARMEPVSFTRWRLDMRRSTLLMCALLTIATSGCKQINEQVQKIKDKIAAARQRNKPAPAQPAPATPQPAPTMDRPLPRDQEPPVPSRPVALADVPYTSADPGTIAPGMGEKEIYSL